MHSGRDELWAAVRSGLAQHAIDPGSLGEYALVLQRGGVARAERAFPAVAAHLRTGCEQCAADLREFPFELEADAASALTPLRRLVAAYVPPMLANVRGADDATRVYEVEDITIWLTTTASVGGYVVDGMITPSGLAAGAPIELGRPYATRVDQLGNFSFDDVAAGVYDLELTLADRVIAVEGLRVGFNGGGTG